MKSSYPPFIKNYLKVTPSAVITMGFFTSFPCIIAIQRYRVKEHLEKQNHKSNRFERLVRHRDDKVRFFDNVSYKMQPGQKGNMAVMM
jgi:hypothetical protein